MRAFGLVEVATAAELKRVKKVVNHNAKVEMMVIVGFIAYAFADLMYSRQIDDEICDLEKRIADLEKENKKEADLFEE